MILSSDLRDIAQARLDDADALLRAGRFDGSVYVCGYAVEIALKARICDCLRWPSYPDTNAEFKGVDSRVLLRDVAKKLAALNHKIVNVDATIIAQAPRMAPHRARMVANIAADLVLNPASVNIKATTTEHLGFLGRMEGIAAQAVALIE